MQTKDTFDFTLTHSIEYSTNGDSREGRVISCTAPTSKQQRFRMELKQGFMRAITSLNSGDSEPQKIDDGSGSKEPTGTEILMGLYSSDIDMPEFMETFKKLACSGVCKIEGEEDLKEGTFDRMDPEDAENLLGDYLVNFILSSALKALNQN